MRAFTFALIALALVGAAAASDVVDLGPYDFDTVVDGSKNVLVEFYAPWCGHCKNLAPEYEEAATAVKAHKDSVVIAKVNADEHGSLGSRFGVKGFPTLKWFPKGVSSSGSPEDYNSGRTAEDIVNFVGKKTGLSVKYRKVQASLDADETNFDKLVLDSSKDVFVEFYAPWCGHCKQLAPAYESFAKAFVYEKDVNIVKVDADSERALGSEYGITGFPTLKFFPKDKKDAPEDYTGGRSAADLIAFMNEKAGTKRNADGTLMETAGRIDTLDDLVEKFKAASAEERESIVKEAEALAGSQESEEDAWCAKMYAKFMANTIKKGENFAAQESERLSKILNSQSVKPDKIKGFELRLNILKAFAN